MIYLIQLGSLIIVLSFLGMLQPVAAEQPRHKPGDESTENIELEQTEITGSLREIIGDFKLQEMEIVGSVHQPKFSTLRWQDPVPFPDEMAELSRGLIDPLYSPLDHDPFSQEVEE
jgi:hypothetical protein